MDDQISVTSKPTFLRANDFYFLDFTLSLILHSADVAQTEVLNEGFSA